MPKIVCISDTHTKHWAMDLPHGHILVVAGDFCSKGNPEEIVDFNDWLGTQPHHHKVVVAGNHDVDLDAHHAELKGLLSNANYLRNQSIDLLGVRFFGMPYQHHFPDWGFYRDEARIYHAMQKMPKNTDVLITHVPPYKVGDVPEKHYQKQVQKGDNDPHVGSKSVRDAVERVKPKFHIFGHIHEYYGKYMLDHLPTIFCNVAICDRVLYEPIRPPTVIVI